MLAKIQAFLTKIETLIHTAIDNVTAQIAGLNTPQKIATAAVAVGLALDVVTVGHFGIVTFIVALVRDLTGVALDAVKTGGLMFILIAVVGYLAYKEFKK